MSLGTKNKKTQLIVHHLEHLWRVHRLTVPWKILQGEG